MTGSSTAVVRTRRYAARRSEALAPGALVSGVQAIGEVGSEQTPGQLRLPIGAPPAALAPLRHRLAQRFAHVVPETRPKFFHTLRK